MNENVNVKSSEEDVDFHLITIPLQHVDETSGLCSSEQILFLRTNDDRQMTKDEAMCSICFYNSEEEDVDEEQEKQITKKTLYDTGRYSQMYKSDVNECEVCSHRFHTVCLYKWIKSSREFKCPLCRASPLPDNNKLSNVPELFCSEPEYIVQYYPNGKIKTECYKENGVLHKFFKKYDLLGNIVYECGYYRGDKHADEIEYHQHTNKRWKIQQYKFGTKNGYYKEYAVEDDDDGNQKLLKHQEWQNGMLHGVEREWFLAYQTKKRYCQYYEGNKHGTEKVWTINGKLIFYKKYEHGRPVGRCIVRFLDNGCLERKCFYNKHGQIDGIYLEWQYACKSLTHENTKNKTKSSGSGSAVSGMGILGMLTGGALNLGGGNNDQQEEEDLKYSSTDVTLKIKAYYIDGSRVGKYEEYHDNGTLKILANYNLNGEYDGEYYEYDRFGRCKLRYMYDDGKLQGLCERFADNGKVSECGWYNDDVLDGIGSYRQYYPNGKLKTKHSYHRGLMHGDAIYYTPKGTVLNKYRYERNQLVS